MKHWCYYANVVRYLEKLEANAVKKKPRGAYLVWRDDEGPHMIAGPDIYWHRGAGPMPDLEGLNISIRSASAARVSKRSAAVLSTPEKANKRRTTFPRSAQICSPKQQSHRRQPAVKTSISPMTSHFFGVGNSPARFSNPYPRRRLARASQFRRCNATPTTSSFPSHEEPRGSTRIHEGPRRTGEATRDRRGHEGQHLNC